VNFKKSVTMLCLGLFLASFSFWICEGSTSKRNYYPNLGFVVIPIASDFLLGVRLPTLHSISPSSVLGQSITQQNQSIVVQIAKPSGTD